MIDGSNATGRQTAQGIVILSMSVLAMSGADAVIKLISDDLTVWQVFAVRSVFAAPCLAAVLYFRFRTVPLSVSRWVILRSALLIVTWLAFYGSLPFLDFTLAATAVYTNPIWITLLSACFLKERISLAQWSGIALGFVGVVAVLQPGTDSFSSAIFMPLAAAVAYASAMVITRGKCRHDAPAVMALNLHLAFMIAGLGASAVLASVDVGDSLRANAVFLFGHWRYMSGADWLLMAFLGVLSAGYFLGVARAYQIGPPQTMAAVDYVYLVFAAMWSMILFAQTPSTLTGLGMIVIVAAGLLASGVITRPRMAG